MIQAAGLGFGLASRENEIPWQSNADNLTPGDERLAGVESKRLRRAHKQQGQSAV
jgi:hypothetical protein